MRQQATGNWWSTDGWARAPRSSALVLATLVVLCGFPLPVHSAAVERISLTIDGTPADGPSIAPRTNGDGSLVVFQSGASKLVGDDHNDQVDVFVADRIARTIERVSRSRLGGDANDASFPAILSVDGRYVAFGSAASNLVLGDFNTLADVFVYDRNAGQNQVVSLSQDGLGGGAVPDLPPGVSQDGVHVAFASQADNLVDNDINQTSDIFVHDTTTGANEVISYTTLGGSQRTGNGPSAGPSISDDGCVVAFYSDANDLVPSDTNQARDVFVRDRCAGTLERVSVSSAGEQAGGPSQLGASAPAVSDTGRYVVFSSNAANLDGANGSTVGNVYRRDRGAGTTSLISQAQDGTASNGASQSASITADGRFVVFQSLASNLVPNDDNGHVDIFVVDTIDGEVRLVSRTEAGAPSDGDSTSPHISADGTRIVFQSSGHLTVDTTENVINIFSAENPLAGKPVPMSPTPTEIETPIETPTETPVATIPEEGTPTETETPVASLTPTVIETGSPLTPTPTVSSGPGSPTVTPTTRRTPTRTATSGVSGNGGSSSGGGGGGCRIDAPNDGRDADTAWAMLLLPLALWGTRRRFLQQPS